MNTQLLIVLLSISALTVAALGGGGLVLGFMKLFGLLDDQGRASKRTSRLPGGPQHQDA